MGRDWCGAGLSGSFELSRSLFVPRSTDVIGMERDWCGAGSRGALSSRGVCLFVPRSTDVIGMGRDWCGAGLAGSAELSRSLFVPRSHDVIGMRGFWCDFFVNAQKWLEKSSLFIRSTFRRICRKKEKKKCLMKKCRKKDALCSAGNGRMVWRTSSNGKQRSEGWRENAKETSCQTIQRNQRAEGTAPRSSTQTRVWTS